MVESGNGRRGRECRSPIGFAGNREHWKNVARPRVGINGVHCTPYSREGRNPWIFSGGCGGRGALEVSVPSEGIIEREKGNKKEKEKEKDSKSKSGKEREERKTKVQLILARCGSGVHRFWLLAG